MTVKKNHPRSLLTIDSSCRRPNHQFEPLPQMSTSSNPSDLSTEAVVTLVIGIVQIVLGCIGLCLSVLRRPGKRHDLSGHTIEDLPALGSLQLLKDLNVRDEECGVVQIESTGICQQ